MGFPIVSVLIMLGLAAGMFYGQAQYKKKKAEWGKTLTILCGILIIVTALYTNLCRSPIDTRAIEREKQYQDAQAIVLAANLAQMYQGGNGKCLLIHHPITGEQGQADLDRIKEAFNQGFGGKVSEIRAVPIKNIPPGNDEMMMEEAMMEMTADDFNKVINANSDCDIVLTMVSLPFAEDELFNMEIFEMIEDEDNPGQYKRNPERKYPLVGIYNGYVGNLTEFFYDKLIGAMSLWKPNPEIDEKPVPEDPQAAFDKRYLIIREDNIDNMEAKYPKLFPKPKEDK